MVVAVFAIAEAQFLPLLAIAYLDVILSHSLINS